MIQINFTKVTPDGVTYSDALYLPHDHTYTEEDIEAMKQKRYDDWYTFLTTPREATEEELENNLIDNEGNSENTVENLGN